MSEVPLHVRSDRHVKGLNARRPPEGVERVSADGGVCRGLGGAQLPRRLSHGARPYTPWETFERVGCGWPFGGVYTPP